MEKTKQTIFLFIFFALVFASNSYATNGMQVIGTGPVVRSMGGAGSALPLDAAAVVANPAGLGELEGRFDFGVTFFIPDSSYEANGGTEKESNTGASPMPAFGFVMPVNDKISLGIGAYGLAGMGVDYSKGPHGLDLLYSSFEMMKFIPAFSYKINDTFSFGTGLNLDYASLGFDIGSTGAGQEAHNKNSQYGYGFQFGVLGKFTKQFSASFAYISKQYFDDFEYYGTAGTDKFAFDLPQNVILGFAYKISDSFRIAADIKWINWSDTMGKNQPKWSQNENGTNNLSADWDDQMVYAIGFEFDLNEDLRLRAGYNYGKNPLSSDRSCESIAFPAVQESHYTAGLGWDITDNATFNTGFMYAPESSISGSNTAQNITAYETSLSEISFELGLGYKF